MITAQEAKVASGEAALTAGNLVIDSIPEIQAAVDKARAGGNYIASIEVVFAWDPSTQTHLLESDNTVKMTDIANHLIGTFGYQVEFSNLRDSKKFKVGPKVLTLRWGDV